MIEMLLFVVIAIRIGPRILSIIDGLIEEVPLGRIGYGDDIASAIYFLAGEEASYVTGQVLGVSGGFCI